MIVSSRSMFETRGSWTSCGRWPLGNFTIRSYITYVVEDVPIQMDATPSLTYHTYLVRLGMTMDYFRERPCRAVPAKKGRSDRRLSVYLFNNVPQIQ